jgi:hypothetical protein
MKISLPVRGAFGQNDWCLYQEPAPPTQGGYHDPSHPFGASQDLHLLLPPGPLGPISSPEWIAIDNELEPDHLARLVDEAVSQLDLSCLISSYAGTGSKAYPPGLMLRIVVYHLAIGEARPAPGGGSRHAAKTLRSSGSASASPRREVASTPFNTAWRPTSITG